MPALPLTAPGQQSGLAVPEQAAPQAQAAPLEADAGAVAVCGACADEVDAADVEAAVADHPDGLALGDLAVGPQAGVAADGADRELALHPNRHVTAVVPGLDLDNVAIARLARCLGDGAQALARAHAQHAARGARLAAWGGFGLRPPARWRRRHGKRHGATLVGAGLAGPAPHQRQRGQQQAFQLGVALQAHFQVIEGPARRVAAGQQRAGRRGRTTDQHQQSQQDPAPPAAQRGRSGRNGGHAGGSVGGVEGAGWGGRGKQGRARSIAMATVPARRVSP
jgi:hypothetical protein